MCAWGKGGIEKLSGANAELSPKELPTLATVVPAMPTDCVMNIRI